jgi:hypothetical protein
MALEVLSVSPPESTVIAAATAVRFDVRSADPDPVGEVVVVARFPGLPFAEVIYIGDPASSSAFEHVYANGGSQIVEVTDSGFQRFSFLVDRDPVWPDSPQISIYSGGGGALTINVEENGTPKGAVDTINFVGPTVNVTGSEATVTGIGATGATGATGSTGATGATGAAGAGVANAEHQLTLGPATLVDWDIYTACPGIVSGDIVAIILTGDVLIDSIKAPPPGTGFGFKIGVRNLSGGIFRLEIQDINDTASVTAGNGIRTPGSSFGDADAMLYQVNPLNTGVSGGSEEGWTEMAYTAISAVWRIIDRTSVAAGSGGSSGGAAVNRFDLTHSPVALWHFNGDLNDSSGNALNMTASGTALFQEIFPNLIGLGPSQPLISRPIHDAILTIYGALTIEVLGVITGTGAFTTVSFTATGETEPTNILWQLDSTLGTDLRNFWELGAGVNGGTGPRSGVRGLPRLHTPCLLATTRAADGSSRMYVNGIPLDAASTGPLALPTGGTTSNVQLPITTNLCRFGIKIIAAELTADEIKAEYNRTLGGAYGFLP